MKIKVSLIIFFAVIVAYYTWNAWDSGVDFDVFLFAAGKLKLHQDIYMPPFIRSGMQYYYSPLFALLLVPFSSLPYYITECLWLILSCIFLCRAWVLCVKYFNTTVLTEKNQRIWLILSFILISRFVLENFNQVQMTVFLLWATLESLSLFKKKHLLLGAALLALAINIKLMPLVFIPYLIYRGMLKETLFTILFYVVYLYLPAIILGIDYNNFLLGEWWKVINPVSAEQSISAITGPNSLDAVIPLYTTGVIAGVKNDKNFVDLRLSQVSLIVNIARLLLVALTLLFLRTLPFKSVKGSFREFWELSYVFFVTPLIFPHMQIYAFMYLFPVFIYLVYFFLLEIQNHQKFNYALLVYFAVLSLAFTPIIGKDVIGRTAYDFFEHYKILTFACLLLLPLPLICRPEKLIVAK